MSIILLSVRVKTFSVVIQVQWPCLKMFKVLHETKSLGSDDRPEIILFLRMVSRLNKGKTRARSFLA